MADKRVTELTAIDAVTGTDLVMVIDDPSGTASNKKATVTQLLASTGSGLVAGPVSASATSNAVVLWDGTSGRLIKDSAVPATSIARKDLDNNFVGQTIAGTLTVEGTTTAVGPVYIGTLASSPNPSLYLVDASQAADSRKFRIKNESALLKFMSMTDSESVAGVDLMHLDRSGTLSVSGDLIVTGEINPVFLAQQKAKIDQLEGRAIGDPAGSRTLLSQSLVSGLSLRHDEALGVGKLTVGNYDTQTYQSMLLEVESFQVHTGTSPGARVEHLRVHPTGGVTVGTNHTLDPGMGVLRTNDLDLVEGVPPDPPVGMARLYSLDVNGYTQVEMRDGATNVVRFASDNVLIAKVAETNPGIARGAAVYISGATGANVLVRLARADDINTMPCIGIALDSGTNNLFIRVLTSGTIAALPTATFIEGATLYVSPTIAGAFTDVIPLAPAFAQRIGFITRSHQTSGEMLVMTTAVVTPPRFHHASHETGGTDALTSLSASILTSGTLPLAALPATVARTDVANTFTQKQTALSFVSTGSGNNLVDLTCGNAAFAAVSMTGRLVVQGGSGQGYSGAGIELQSTTPRISFHWIGVVASQIGVASDGSIRTYDNPGTGYAPMYAQNFYGVGSSNSLGDLTVRGATNFMGGINVTAGGMTVTGAATITGGLTLSNGGGLVAAGAIYPGRIDVGPWTGQTNWYFAGHGSYGLYSNTGLYLEGPVWASSASIRGAASVAGYFTVSTPGGSGDASIFLTNNGASVNFRIMSYTDRFLVWNAATSAELLSVDGNGSLTVPGLIHSQGYGCKQGIYNAWSGHHFNFHWDGTYVQQWIDATNMGAIDVVVSDARMKRDFTPLVGSLDTVRQLRPGSFYYTEGSEQDLKHHGLLAQDVLPIAPELVRHNDMITPKTPDGMFMMNYAEMVPLLIGAIQELEHKVAAMEMQHG